MNIDPAPDDRDEESSSDDERRSSRKPDTREGSSGFSARDLLTQEELRELWSPLKSEKIEAYQVLLLTDQPEDVPLLSKHFRDFGVDVVPCNHRFAASEYFQKHKWNAVLASYRSLGVEATSFVNRIRDIDREVQIGLFREDDDQELENLTRLDRVVDISRPFQKEQLDEFAQTFLPQSALPKPAPPSSSQAASGDLEEPKSPSEPGEKSAPRVQDERAASTDDLEETDFEPVPLDPESKLANMREEVASEREGAPASLTGETRASLQSESEPQRDRPEKARHTAVAAAEAEVSTSRSASLGQGPNLLAGLRALLEARLEGRGVESALQAWLREDSDLVGVVSLDTQGPGHEPKTVELIVTAGSLEDRSRVLERVAHELADLRWTRDREVAVRGPFLFIRAEGDSQRTFLYSRSLEQLDPEEIEQQLEPLASLIGRIPAPTRRSLDRIAGATPRAGRATESPRRTPDVSAASLDRSKPPASGRLVDLLRGLMLSAERRGEALGLFVIASADDSGGEVRYGQGRPFRHFEWLEPLRLQLRDSDWLEQEGPCVYLIVEEFQQDIGEQLETNLERFLHRHALRMVGRAWVPGDEEADQLLSNVRERFQSERLRSGFILY